MVIGVHGDDKMMIEFPNPISIRLNPYRDHIYARSPKKYDWKKTKYPKRVFGLESTSNKPGECGFIATVFHGYIHGVKKIKVSGEHIETVYIN
jgi:hypothetical protein